MSNSNRLTIAMVGTRGVPAAYGGFETAIEEVGRRLADRGHDVVVYTRGSERREKEYLGMRVVHLPAIPVKQIETLSHTGLSALHLMFRRRPDATFVFNAANSPFLPLLRLRRAPVALHMDGLEWRRSKWGPRGKAYYRWAEQFGVRTADALIADAPGIADYYRHQFDVPTELIRYGAPILDQLPERGVAEMDLTPEGYHLVVARFEPENHVLEIVRGYRDSDAKLPLVVVGSAPYSAGYTQEIQRVADGDDRIRLVGASMTRSCSMRSMRMRSRICTATLWAAPTPRSCAPWGPGPLSSASMSPSTARYSTATGGSSRMPPRSPSR